MDGDLGERVLIALCKEVYGGALEKGAPHDYHTPKMERCLHHLHDEQGHDDESSHRICYASILGAGHLANRRSELKDPKAHDKRLAVRRAMDKWIQSAHSEPSLPEAWFEPHEFDADPKRPGALGHVEYAHDAMMPSHLHPHAGRKGQRGGSAPRGALPTTVAHSSHPGAAVHETVNMGLNAHQLPDSERGKLVNYLSGMHRDQLRHMSESNRIGAHIAKQNGDQQRIAHHQAMDRILHEAMAGRPE